MRLPEIERVIDYAHSGERSDWLDIYLAAACRFWLASNSGFFITASAFGVPVLLTNVAPMSFRPWVSGDVSIPKLYRWRETGELLTFERALAADLHFAQDIDRLGIEVVGNSPDELCEVTLEMLARVAGRWSEGSSDRELQARYAALTPYSPQGIASRIGRLPCAPPVIAAVASSICTAPRDATDTPCAIIATVGA